MATGAQQRGSEDVRKPRNRGTKQQGGGAPKLVWTATRCLGTSLICSSVSLGTGNVPLSYLLGITNDTLHAAEEGPGRMGTPVESAVKYLW